jgi:hypothetical protein
VGATLLGVSVDTPFALNEFRDQEDLSFGLVSDTDKEIIDAYDVEMDFEALGYYGLAKRAVFVVDENGEVAYDWVSDDPASNRLRSGRGRGRQRGRVNHTSDVGRVISLQRHRRRPDASYSRSQ